jgi:hypothetical protein
LIQTRNLNSEEIDQLQIILTQLKECMLPPQEK